MSSPSKLSPLRVDYNSDAVALRQAIEVWVIGERGVEGQLVDALLAYWKFRPDDSPEYAHVKRRLEQYAELTLRKDPRYVGQFKRAWQRLWVTKRWHSDTGRGVLRRFREPAVDG